MAPLPTATNGEVITSRSNARVKQLRAAFAGQARLSGGLLAIEGDHLLEEALRSGQVLKTIFLSERRERPAWLPYGIESLRLASDVFAGCVDVQSPQGIAALLVPPTGSLERMLAARVQTSVHNSVQTRTPSLLLILAGLQDPGNLGTLIRSAEAFGATGVLTTVGTVSPWNGKALRASAGSAFRVPLAEATPESLKRLKQNGVHLYAAVKNSTQPIEHADLRQSCALIIGNEGAGIDEATLAFADTLVTIPCPGPVESLNAAVAGSLLLYEASRQRSHGGSHRS